MKTNQNIRKLTLISRVILLSFTLSIFISSRVCSQKIDNALISFVPKEKMYSSEVYYEYKINKFEEKIHSVMDNELKLENWMMNLERWENARILENKLSLEDWMMNPAKWYKKDFTDNKLEIEDWMCCPEQFFKTPDKK